MKKFDNFVSNLNTLSKAEGEDLSNEFIISGIIGKFFIQFELGWKVLKELLKYEGRSTASGHPERLHPCVCKHEGENYRKIRRGSG